MATDDSNKPVSKPVAGTVARRGKVAGESPLAASESATDPPANRSRRPLSRVSARARSTGTRKASVRASSDVIADAATAPAGRTDVTITALRARPVVVPMAVALPTSQGVLDRAALILIDLETSAGTVGHSYLFAIGAQNFKPIVGLLDAMADMIVGQPLAPFHLERLLRARYALLGVHNIVLFAMSGIDIAAWDAHAKLLGEPLVRVLGGKVRPIRAYNSKGLGIMPKKALAAQAVALLDEGFDALKIRLGRDKASADVAAVRAVRKAIGPDATLMCDFNQALSLNEALLRCRMLDDEGGLTWIEEPIRADDFSGYAELVAVGETPISIGENFMGPEQMAQALAAGAANFVMPDVQRIMGVTGWLRAAALAQAYGLEMSSHLFPEVSAHLMAVTPTAHWLEYVDWANPILAEPIQVRDGHVVIPERPGSGVAWNEAAVSRYAA